jgi:hypothetical protein
MDLITDRKRSDVVNMTAKGQYAYTDINRVETAVQTLATALNNAGYYVAVTVKTNWTAADKPSRTDMERYRTNISTIRATLAVFSSTPAVPDSMRYLGYQSANDIEQILLDVERLINNMQAAFCYSGENYAGEV